MKRIARGRMILLLVAFSVLILCLLPQEVRAEGASVTVYLTVSSDGEFLRGRDDTGTVMARVPVEVEAFDLADYGLEKYRFGDGQAPTVLHLLLCATEKYHLNRALTPADVKSNAICVTGGPGSLYLKYFWEHDENLMYFVNHIYPLQSAGIGATADTIVLEDGDSVDLGMFTNRTFHQRGAFASFDTDVIEGTTGEGVRLTLRSTETASVQSGTQSLPAPMTGEAVRVSRDGGKTWVWKAAVTDSAGQVSLQFAEPGCYWVASGPGSVRYRDVAPAVTTVTVTGSARPWTERDVDFSKERAHDDSVSPASPEIEGRQSGSTPPAAKKIAPPEKVALSKVKPGKKKLTVKWKNVSKATGYQIAVQQKGKAWKYYRAKATARRLVVKKLKRKKKYYVKVRAYRTAGGKTCYGAWSVVKKAKTK